MLLACGICAGRRGRSHDEHEQVEDGRHKARNPRVSSEDIIGHKNGATHGGEEDQNLRNPAREGVVWLVCELCRWWG